MKRTRLGAFLLVSIFISACGQSAQKSKGPQDEFQGAWRSNCTEGQKFALLSKSNLGITQVSEIDILGNAFSETTIVSSSSCASRDIEMTSSGSFDREPTSDPSIQSLEVNLDSHRVKPLTEFGVKVLSLAKFCGIEDWVVEQERDVSGLVSEKKCFSHERLLTVYSVIDGQLYFGTRERVSSSSDVPLVLKKDLFYNRELQGK